MGARKVVIGQANNVSFSQFKSDIDGKMYNKAEVTYSLKVYNIADGAMIGSEDLSVSGIDADSKDGAFNDAMKDLRKGMVGFVDKHFKFETYILELGEADKKGRVKELYISGGTEMGVAKKTRFKVFLERKIGPKVTKSEIGTIVAVEVMDGVTKCQVASTSWSSSSTSRGRRRAVSSKGSSVHKFTAYNSSGNDLRGVADGTPGILSVQT